MENDELTRQLLSEFNESNDLSDNDELNDELSDERANKDDESHYDGDLNKKGLIPFVFTWIEGLRSGSRLVWVPAEECLYYSNAISKKQNAIACTCYIKGCKVRILILDDGTAAKEVNTADHIHGSLYNVYKERSLYTYMKERCRTAPASAVIRDIYHEAVVL